MLRHEAQKVHGEINDLNVEFVLDRDYKKGTLSPLQTGLKNYVGAMDAFIKDHPVLLSGDFAANILAHPKSFNQNVRDVFRDYPQYFPTCLNRHNLGTILKRWISSS